MDSFALLIALSACSRGLSPKTAEHPASTNAESKITTTGAGRFIMYLMSESSLPRLDALTFRSCRCKARARLASRPSKEGASAGPGHDLPGGVRHPGIRREARRPLREG